MRKCIRHITLFVIWGIWSLLFQPFALCVDVQAATDVATARGEGTANIYGGNTAAARSKALDQALRNVVESQVGVFITSDTMVHNYVLIRDKILSRSEGYIDHYSIVDQGVRSGGLEYFVIVEAMVKKGRLTTKLQEMGLLHVLKEKPKLMILIEEKNMGVFGSTGWENVSEAETTLMELFLEKEFNVVDPSTIRSNVNREKALRIIEGDNRAAAIIGLQYGAQLAIIGKAISKNASGGRLKGTKLQSIQAVVTARVVETDSGKVIASRSERSSKAHIDEVIGGSLAIRKASKKLAQKLMDQIVSKWQKDVYGSSRELILTINGLVSYLHLDCILDFLENEVQGIKNVYQRSYTGGVAELALDYAGKTRALAGDLARHKFKGFRLNPTDVTPNKINVQVFIQK